MPYLFAILFLCVAAVAQSAEQRPPNIVLIVADDLGYGELGCYGQRWIKTPRIDELASQGARMTQFYAGAPVCAPSRCVLMTGKHLGSAAIRDNRNPEQDDAYKALKSAHGWEFPGQTPLPTDEVTIAELLKQRGYATGAAGKWGLGHFGTTGDPNRQGFDLFFGFNCQVHAHNHYPRFLWRNGEKVLYPGNDRKLRGETYSQDEFTRVALEFIREHREEPFFMYVPYAVPHLSIQAPDASITPYVDQIPEAEYTHRGYLPHPTPRAGYAGMVTHLDADVGRIVDLLEELGLTDDTLVIFTSDNGPTYERLGGSDSDFFESAAGLRGLKGSVYEGGIRVPMVARWPGRIEPGEPIEDVGAFWDLLPTLCEAADATAPTDLDGVSLLPALTGQPAGPRPALVWDFPGYRGQQAVRMGDYKAVRTNLNRGNKAFELYDLANDPQEKNDIAADHPDLVAKAEALFAELAKRR